jgi:type VI protein secretion system component Hcp
MRKLSSDAVLKSGKNRDKGTNQDPKISKELSDSELNKATGGKVAMADFPITKKVDKSSP